MVPLGRSVLGRTLVGKDGFRCPQWSDEGSSSSLVSDKTSRSQITTSRRVSPSDHTTWCRHRLFWSCVRSRIFGVSCGFRRPVVRGKVEFVTTGQTGPTNPCSSLSLLRTSVESGLVVFRSFDPRSCSRLPGTRGAPVSGMVMVFREWTHRSLDVLLCFFNVVSVFVNIVIDTIYIVQFTVKTHFGRRSDTVC